MGIPPIPGFQSNVDTTRVNTQIGTNYGFVVG